jgi:hypothetical protein
MRTRIDIISDGKGRESISMSVLGRGLGGGLGGFALAFGRSCGSGGSGRRRLGGAGVVCTALGHFEGELHLRLVRRARLVVTHSINRTVLTGQLPRSPTSPGARSLSCPEPPELVRSSEERFPTSLLQQMCSRKVNHCSV